MTRTTSASLLVFRASVCSFAFVLFIAASLKVAQLPTLHWNRATLFPVTVAACEWLLGCWLLIGVLPALARRVLIAVLLVFLAATGLRWWDGQTSCGCFGKARVHPSLTFLFDLAVLLIVWRCGRMVVDVAPARADAHGPSQALRFASIMAFSIALPLAVIATQRAPVRNIFADPNDWVGKSFPLFEHFVEDDDARALRDGKWSVLLFDHDCETCRKLIKRLKNEEEQSRSRIRYIDLAGTLLDSKSQERLGLHPIAIDPTVRLVIRVPVIIEIRDGVVIFVDASPSS